MLYATVRNRKISVKKPTTIPCNGKNVDFLTLDLDEDWSGIKSILCTFSNDHLVSQKKKKTVTETTVTVTTTKDEQNISTVETVDKKTEYAEFTKGDEEDVGVTTSTTTTVSEDEGTKTTTTEEIITVSIVEVSESQTVKRGVLYFPGAGNVVKIPHACVVNEGQLSVWLTGYDAEIVEPDGDIEDPEQFTTDSTKVLTMATPDSFWELVENGEPAGNLSDDEATTLYDDAMAAVGLAKAAANAAKATADDLSNKAESGAFNGVDGRTPQISVGTVETTEPGGAAAVTASGTSTDVKLNFKLPRGRNGVDGKDGKDGETPDINIGRFIEGSTGGVLIDIAWPNQPDRYQSEAVYDGKTPQRGVDYWTQDDVAEIKNYIDNEIGNIEGMFDMIIADQEYYIAQSPTPVNEEVAE